MALFTTFIPYSFGFTNFSSTSFRFYSKVFDCLLENPGLFLIKLFSV